MAAGGGGWRRVAVWADQREREPRPIRRTGETVRVEASSGEAPVERIGELQVPVPDEVSGAGVEGGPATERGEGFGDGVLACGEGGEEEANALEALVAKPPLLEGGERAPGGSNGRIDVLRVGAGLFDAEGETLNARMDDGRLGGVRCGVGRWVGGGDGGGGRAVTPAT